MDKEQFWRTLDDARALAGRWQDMRYPLVYALTQLDAQDIICWQRIFIEYQSLSYKDKLWAAAAIMLGGCSDDSFDYFRGWLTAQGKDVFIGALADPDSLASVKTVQAYAQEAFESEYLAPLAGYRESARFERILYAASYAYKIRTGQDDFYDKVYESDLPASEKQSIADDITYASDIDAKWGGIDTDWLHVDQELQRLLPRLHREFNKEEPQEKDSVIAKIREARAAAKNDPPPVRDKPQSKKSHEPEV